jgi:hypothetical protein
MTNSKSLRNGHDAPKALSQSQSAIRSRRYRERRKRGVVIIRDIEITPDLAQALISCNWLNALERNSREALLASIGALLYRSLSSGVTPSEKPLLPVDLEILQAAWIWAKPGTEPSPQAAGRAIGTAIKCAGQLGVSPETYASVMKQRVGIVASSPYIGISGD